MTTQKTLLTAEEFYLFCCENDGWYELVEGEVVELAPPNDEHGDTALNVGTAFKIYSRRRGEGQARVETGYTLRTGPDTVRGPDVSFVFHPRVEGRGSGFPVGAPDIAVEVVSPSDTAAGMARKVAEYLAAGSQRVWVVYPRDRRVVVHCADGAVLSYGEGDVITDEELLPGFSLPLSEIFGNRPLPCRKEGMNCQRSPAAHGPPRPSASSTTTRSGACPSTTTGSC